MSCHHLPKKLVYDTVFEATEVYRTQTAAVNKLVVIRDSLAKKKYEI